MVVTHVQREMIIPTHDYSYSVDSWSGCIEINTKMFFPCHLQKAEDTVAYFFGIILENDNYFSGEGIDMSCNFSLGQLLLCPYTVGWNYMLHIPKLLLAWYV